jgi:hypothetical protein
MSGRSGFCSTALLRTDRNFCEKVTGEEKRITVSNLRKWKKSPLFDLSWFIISVAEHLLFERALPERVSGARWRLVDGLYVAEK